jgi:UDP-N-acetylglucosamine--N-acetylmuramyl-(pentapeptide) pyrophosphoryl-undecaprenol N-acetylglucosamine transferase
MASALAASDLVVSRSGALTLAEITARGVASVLIPHPYVPDDVQRKNAYAMLKAGSSVVIENAELDGDRLFMEVSALIKDKGRLEIMADCARKMAMPDAAVQVADLAERHMLGGGAR